MKQGAFSSDFDDALIKQILKMIEDGNPSNLPNVLEMQLNPEIIPDWHKNEIIARIYLLLKEKQTFAKTRKSREKYHSAIEIMDDKYGSNQK